MRRVVVVVGTLGSLALWAGAGAVAAPIEAPVLAPVPDILGYAELSQRAIDPAQRISWTPITLAGCGSYEVEITDLTAGTARVQEVRAAFRGSPSYDPAQAPPTELVVGSPYFFPTGSSNTTDLADGHRYAFRVRGVERADPEDCGGSVPEPGPWSARSAETVHDGQAPTLRAALDGGAEVTRSAEATLEVTALSDVSGVRTLEVEGLAQTAPVTGRYLVRLAGTDGLRTVGALARDRAGNQTTVSDTILVDRAAPVVSLRRAGERAPVGAAVSVDAAGSVDPPPTGGPASGIAPDGFRWRFGDGLPGAVSPTAAHVFRRSGVYCGSVSVADRAGNVGVERFVTRVGTIGGRRLGRVAVAGRPTAGGTATIALCLARRSAVVVALRSAAGRLLAVRRRPVVPGATAVALRLPRAGGRYELRIAAGAERRTLRLRV